MSVTFSWEFEEEQPDPSGAGGDSGGTPRWRRRLVLALLALILLAIIGLAVRAWVKRRTDAVAQVESALRSVVELELKTIAEGDAELFRSLQDPADQRWRIQQDARYFYFSESFVPAPGLAPAERPPEVDQVHVLGATGRAELTRWYDDGGSSVAGSPLPFHFTWFYRQDEKGDWYHVAAPDGYWGVPYSWYGSRLIIRATETEAGLIDPIARELALLVAEGCRFLDCPPNQRYTLSFDGERTARLAQDWWILPALHLTGLPEDGAARSAWIAALKRWLVEALAQTRAGGERFTDRFVYREMVRRLQAELGSSAVGTPDGTMPDTEPLARALQAGELHSLQSLWEARTAGTGPEERRLLETEIPFMLQWMEGQVGADNLYGLLPAMERFERLDAALSATYPAGGRGISDPLPSGDSEAAWLAYVSDVTGVRLPSVVGSGGRARLFPPAPPPTHSISPGNELAFVCNDRIWVSNADGTNRIALTGAGQRFEGLAWSPDGRWLLTQWLSPNLDGLGAAGSDERRALYLLASDGSGARLLTDDPAWELRALGWHPDGARVLFDGRRDTTARGTERWAVEIGSGRLSNLLPRSIWSPDGQHLVYVTEPPGDNASTVWLADSNGENGTPIAEDVGVWPGASWTSDSRRVALVLYDVAQDESRVVVYDLGTGDLSTLATDGDLAGVPLTLSRSFSELGADPATLMDRPLHTLRVSGWSAGDENLLVKVQWEAAPNYDTLPTAWAILSDAGIAPRLVAYGPQETDGQQAAWSPADPNQLFYTWFEAPSPAGQPVARLLDLARGPIFSHSDVRDASWSPDGAWLALAGDEHLTVQDWSGRERFVQWGGGPCSAVAWNPTVALAGRDSTAVPVSGEGAWSFANVRVYRDGDAPLLHVIGELVSHTPEDRRVTLLRPTWIETSIGRIPVVTEYPLGYHEMIQGISLREGRSLPFGFAIRLPEVALVEDVGIVLVEVRSESAQTARDDLDIPYDEYDLSGWPARLDVGGIFENPGAPLTEQVTVVVLAYDEEGRVMGWGWNRRTDPAYLGAGGHFFQVDVPVAQVTSDPSVGIGYYKVQLFGY